MAKNPLTASERRGIIVVAALALLITGSSLWLSRCGRPETTVTPEEVQILLDGSETNGGRQDLSKDSLSGNSGKSGERKAKSKSSNKKRREKESKTYRKRSHLDEPVDLD